MRHFDITGLCIFLIAFLVASVGLFTYFSFDDYIYLRLAQEYASSLKTFFTPFWTFNPWIYYRPLPSMFWVILFTLFGPFPTPYELGIMFIFATMVFFVYRLGNLLGGRIAGVVAGLLVLFYFPIYSLSWLRSSSSLQMELFFVASGMFYIARWAKSLSTRHAPKSLPWLGIALLIGAFLSKEASFLIPLLLPLLVPKRRVIKLAAGLFVTGIGIFFVIRNLIEPGFPLHVPRFDLMPIAGDLEFFLCDQFLFYLPASLIVLAALAWGSRNRHVYLLLCVVAFFLIDAFVGYTVTTQRAKLAVCLVVLAYCFINAPAKARCLLVWVALLFIPPLSVLDTNIHQSDESFVGLALFLGIGVARQTRLASRIGRSIVRAHKSRAERPKGIAGGLHEQTLGLRARLARRLRIAGALLCVLLLGYAAYSIVSLNLRIGVAEARMAIQQSRLTSDLREYLCGLQVRDMRVHMTNLPRLISVPDFPFDALLHGCWLIVDERISARMGIFALTNETPKRIIDDVTSRSHLIKRLSRGPHEVLVFLSPKQWLQAERPALLD
ncbi:MAG TPA: hypothetical protein VM163_04830 [bacterium]|nr:hypothetical protein [bacterium]